MRTLSDLLRAPPRVQQGKVLSVDQFTVRVVVGGRTRSIRRTGSLAMKAGDRISLQGDTVVGRRKPPPTGATYEI